MRLRRRVGSARCLAGQHFDAAVIVSRHLVMQRADERKTIRPLSQPRASTRRSRCRPRSCESAAAARDTRWALAASCQTFPVGSAHPTSKRGSPTCRSLVVRRRPASRQNLRQREPSQRKRADAQKLAPRHRPGTKRRTHQVSRLQTMRPCGMRRHPPSGPINPDLSEDYALTYPTWQSEMAFWPRGPGVRGAIAVIWERTRVGPLTPDPSPSRARGERRKREKGKFLFPSPREGEGLGVNGTSLRERVPRDSG